MRRILFLGWLLAIVLTLGPAAPGIAAPGPTIDQVVNAFSDEELIAGFMATVFGTETFRQGLQVREAANTVKKFSGPVRVYIDNRASVDRTDILERFIAVLDSTVNNLTIRTVTSDARANMIIYLVDRMDYRRTIRSTLPKGFDTSFLEYNACSAVTGGRRNHGLERAYVYIAANEGLRNFRHCMIEEITQSLGPVNDDSSLEHSIFNDNSRLGGFGVFDWFIVNMVYDERVRNGMTPDEVRPVLPAAVRDARRRLPRILRERRLAGPELIR